MSKESVLEEFQSVYADPESKDGGYLYLGLLDRAKRLVITDRIGVVEALRYWISLRDHRHTNHAAMLTGALALKELKPDLEKLREDIISRKAYLTKYTGWVDKELKKIKSSNSGPE
jgi:hypothetical protein